MVNLNQQNPNQEKNLEHPVSVEPHKKAILVIKNI